MLTATPMALHSCYRQDASIRLLSSSPFDVVLYAHKERFVDVHVNISDSSWLFLQQGSFGVVGDEGNGCKAKKGRQNPVSARTGHINSLVYVRLLFVRMVMPNMLQVYGAR